jgi:hypothetical protein
VSDESTPSGRDLSASESSAGGFPFTDDLPYVSHEDSEEENPITDHVVEHGIAEAVAHEAGVGVAGPFAGLVMGLEDDQGGHSKDVDPNTGLPREVDADGLYRDVPEPITPNWEYDPLPKDINISSDPDGGPTTIPEDESSTPTNWEYDPLPKDINISPGPEDGTVTIPEDDSYYTWETPIDDDGTRGEPGEGNWVDPIE